MSLFLRARRDRSIVVSVNCQHCADSNLKSAHRWSIYSFYSSRSFGLIVVRLRRVSEALRRSRMRCRHPNILRAGHGFIECRRCKTLSLSFVRMASSGTLFIMQNETIRVFALHKATNTPCNAPNTVNWSCELLRSAHRWRQDVIRDDCIRSRKFNFDFKWINAHYQVFSVS